MIHYNVCLFARLSIIPFLKSFESWIVLEQLNTLIKDFQTKNLMFRGFIYKIQCHCFTLRMIYKIVPQVVRNLFHEVIYQLLYLLSLPQSVIAPSCSLPFMTLKFLKGTTKLFCEVSFSLDLSRLFFSFIRI